MGWNPNDVPDPQDPATFRRSKLDWSELDEAGHAALRDVYRQLIHLRRSVPELTDSRFSSLKAEFDDDSGWFRLDRNRISIVVNFGDKTTKLPDQSEVLLTTSSVPERLVARSAAIVRRVDIP
jgi:maltooligosyltrehalose trehalohydrolase